MKLLCSLSMVLLLLGGCAQFCKPAGGPSVQPGEKVVFFGDSITRGGVQPNGYVTLAAAAVEQARPGEGIIIVGSGIGGNRVPNLQERLDRDVLALDPDVVVIYIGINDVWHWKNGKGTTRHDFEAGLHNLVDRIEAAGARAVLCTPTVIGERTDGSNAFDAMLDDYASVTRQVARERNLTLIDLRQAFMSYLAANNPNNEPKGILTTDEVHLNVLGNRFLANLMLAGLGLPSLDEAR